MNLAMLRSRLEELASLDEQERVWLGNSSDVMSSFEEAVCGVFDDAGITRAMDSGVLRKEFGDEVFDQFRALDALIQKVPVNLAPSDLVSRPLLANIRAASCALLESKMFPK